MDDDSLMRAVWQRCRDPQDQLDAAQNTIQKAEDQIKALKLKVWEKHKDAASLKNAVKLADEAVETLRSEISDTNEEICSLGSQVRALDAELEDVTRVARENAEDAKLADETAETLRLELSDASEENHSLTSRAEALEAEIEKVTEVAREKAQETAKLANQAAEILRLELSDANEEICSLESRAESSGAEMEKMMKVAREEAEKTLLANEAAEALRLKLDDANKEICSLHSRAEALKSETENEMKITLEQIGEAREEIAALQTRNDCLERDLAGSVETNVELREELETAKLTLITVREQAQTAVEEAFAKCQISLAAKISTPEPAAKEQGAATAQYQSQIELLTTQLRLRDNNLESLQNELQQEKRAYENLVKSNKKKMLKARSVSTDLLHEYLANDKEGLKQPKTPMIKLREHEWVLSRVADPPRESNQPEGSAQVESECSIRDTPGSPIPEKTSTAEPSNVCQVSTDEVPMPAKSQDPRKFGRRSRVCICTRCYQQNRFCTSGVQCGPCTEAGEQCTYKHCYSGMDCRFPRCGFVHPGQEVVDGYERHMVGSRHGPKRRRLE